MCYATADVFVARLVDRANRVKLIAVCVAIWAVSTALCGFATSFAELLAARAGTAIAEAALSPAALSIFSDIFAPRKVARASSVFMLGPYIGGGLALFCGGMLLSATRGDVSIWLASHGFAPWQAVFVLVGAPGFVLAALVAFTVREPARHEGDAAHVSEALAELARSRHGTVRSQSLWCVVFRGVCRAHHLVLFACGMVSDLADAQVSSGASTASSRNSSSSTWSPTTRTSRPRRPT